MSSVRCCSAFAVLLAFAASLAIDGAAYGAAQSDVPIPDIARALLDAAYASGDPEEIAHVAKAARAVFPDHDAAIAAQAAQKIAALQASSETSPPAPSPPGPPALPAEAALKAVAAPVMDAAPETTRKAILAMAPWDGKVSASGIVSSGNSENAAIGVAIDAARAAGAFKHNIKAYFDIGESNGVTNQKRWGASYKLDYDLGDRTYAFARLSYDEDQFSGFDYRLFAGGGLGHAFFKESAFSWKLEGGPGYRYSPIDITRAVEQHAAFYAANEIDWLIRDDLKFEHDVNVTWTSPTTTVQSVAALTTKLWGELSTGLSFEYRYETDPPDNRENTDTIAKASLIYGF